MNKKLDKKLWIWGEWKRLPLHGLDYPSVTSLYRVWKEGEGAVVRSIPGSNVLNYWPDHKAIEIDKLVEKLPNTDKKPLKTAIYVRYVDLGSSTQGANQCKCSTRTYWRLIDRAHILLNA